MRTHIVLVPGFGGFDALGQLRYYVQVTSLFNAWREARRGAAEATALHYFDNLPTASVATRAKKLRGYLDKLIERNIVAPQDQIVLGGHSTGGLDIRQLIATLIEQDDERMLARLGRVMFMSVPHRGTNLADWIRARPDLPIRASVRLLRWAAAKKKRVPDRIEKFFEDRVPGEAALFDAVEDVRNDFEPCPENDPLEIAEARRAKSEVELWLRYTADDFLAIDDLACASTGKPRILDSTSEELGKWGRRGFETRSYATLGRCPFSKDELRKDRTARTPRQVYGAVMEDIPATDAIYRAGYAMTSCGPFSSLSPVSVRWLPGVHHPGTADMHTLEDWDNDGVVNTASMVWDPDRSFLVPGDHADIIGHFAKLPNHDALPGQRKCEGYDLLASDSMFTKQTFRTVWHDAFDFSVAQPATSTLTTRRAQGSE